MMHRVQQALRTYVRDPLVDLVYPKTCASCGQRGVWVCDLCIQEFTPLVPELCCDRCGHPVIHGRCECRNMHPAIAKARAAGVFDGWIAQSIRAMKYDRERDRAAFLAESMGSAIADLGGADVIVPVPLHPTRQDWRGFNQAEVLAERLGDIASLPVENALQRNRETDSQTHSSREDRLANMDGAFDLEPNWSLDPGAHYVLLDDVYTTGATLGACAEVLDAAGARLISVVTITFDLQRRELDAYRSLVNAATTV